MDMGSIDNALKESIAAPTDEVYLSDDEYTRHQKTHERFFRRTTKNTTARAALEKLKGELTAKSPLTQISLDRLSSRTRIIMFRELIAASGGKKLSIPLSFHGNAFKLDLTPTEHQPGSGILTCIGTYAGDVYPVIESYKEKAQAKFAKKLVKTRTAPHADGQLDYHPNIPNPKLTEGGKKVNLEALNLLLDFEVARRMIGSKAEEDAAYAVAKGATAMSSPIKTKTKYADIMDSVPVASSIVGLLQLPQKDQSDSAFIPLEKFFYAPNVGRGGFNYGDLNAFEGAALDYSRELATKKIIRKLRGGDQAKPSTKEQIHQEYLTYYGGGSESEGDSYDTPVSSDDEE